MYTLTQRLSQRLKIQQILTVLSIFLLTISASISLASDPELSELKEQQQKLQQILDEIVDVREQRAEQKAMLEKLNQKMECNWALIKDYDICDKKYKEQKQEQAACVQQAKEKANKCLSEIDNHETTEF